MKMKQIITIWGALCCMFLTVSADFCSVYCSLDDCNGITSNNCLGCDFPLTINATTNKCQIKNAQIILVADQANITISANVSLSTVTCGMYSFQGVLDRFSMVTLTYGASITQKHFRVVLYFWLILYDGWGSNDNFTVSLTSTGATQVMYVADASVAETVCSGSQVQNYMKAKFYFAHSSNSDSVIFTVKPFSSGNREWGIKEPIIFAYICDISCDGCTGSSNSECTACATNFYQSGTMCNTSCALGYVTPLSGTVCIPCDVSCHSCQNTTLTCLICNTSHLMVRNNNTCVQNCPNGYFIFNTECIDCFTYCVNVTIIQLNFPSETNKTLYVDVSFSNVMDFNSFPISDFLTFYSLNDTNVNLLDQSTFKIQAMLVNSTSFRVQIQYQKTNALDFQLACYVSVKYQTLKNLENGFGYKMDDSVYLINTKIHWYIEKTTFPSQTLPQTHTSSNFFSESLKKANDWTSEVLSRQYVQQIKKTGVFTILFPGIQLTSLILLTNQTKAVNNYQAARFWGLFVYFDVPQWEQQSNLTNFIIAQPSQQVIKHARLLFQTSNLWFRFRRTGFTSFFLFDTYMSLISIALAWVILVLSFFLAKKIKVDFFIRKLHKVYIFFHKTHQIAIFYVFLAAALEWSYFSGISMQRWVSLIVQGIVLLYFFAYHLYVYWELLEFPIAAIQTKRYEKIIEKYSYFVRNVKFNEYDIRQTWRLSHILQPYNFQIVTNYKWILMVISLPIFYQIPYAQLTTLIAIQTIEIIRTALVRPYYQKCRNLLRIMFQSALFLLFLFSLLNQVQFNRLQSGVTVSTQLFNVSDWSVLICIFTLNVGLILYSIGDFVYSCLKSDRFRIEQARRRFYMQKIEQVESYQSKKDILFIDCEYQEEMLEMQRIRSPKNVSRTKTPLTVDTYLANTSYCTSIKQQKLRQYTKAQQNNIKKWIKLGNLNYFDYQSFQEIPVKIQEYRIYKAKQEFQIKAYKAIQIYMDDASTYRKKNNIIVTKSINKILNLGFNPKDSMRLLINSNHQSNQFNSLLSALVHKIYDTYAKKDTKYVYFQLFLKVNQRSYDPGEEIQVRFHKLFQIVKEQGLNGNVIKEKSEWIFQPFPIAASILNSL